MTRPTSRLELTWIGKNIRPRLEPRILLGDQERSYHAAIFGDNLPALEAGE